MTRSHRLLFCFSLLRLQPIEPRSEIFDLARQSQYAQFVIAESRLQLVQQAHYIAQFAFHRERPFGTLFATSDSYVMETLSRLRKEKCVGVRQRKLTCGGWLGNDVAVAQFRQDDFQRSSKAIQHTNRMLERD